MNASTNKKGGLNSLSTTKKWLLLLCVPLLAYPILPVVIILLIGLLPTITVLITDIRNSNKIIIVGCFNLAGVFVYIMNLANNYNVNGAFNIVSNIFNLIIMLGAAAVGIILYSELPSLFIIVSDWMRKRNLNSIETKLKKLEENWGNEIFKADESKAKKIAKPKPTSTPVSNGK